MLGRGERGALLTPGHHQEREACHLPPSLAWARRRSHCTQVYLAGRPCVWGAGAERCDEVEASALGGKDARPGQEEVLALGHPSPCVTRPHMNVQQAGGGQKFCQCVPRGRKEQEERWPHSKGQLCAVSQVGPPRAVPECSGFPGGHTAHSLCPSCVEG